MSEGRTPSLRFEGFNQEWASHRFGEAFSFLRHNSLSRAQLTRRRTGVRNIHYGDILVKFGSVLDLSAARLPYIRNPKSTGLGDHLRDGDVVFADAAEDATVGKCTEVRAVGETPVVPGLHTITARPSLQFGKGFLGHLLNADAFHDQLIPLMQGTKVSSISVSALSTCSVVAPTVEEQRQIGAFFSELDAVIAHHRARHSKLEQTKVALMQKIFPQGDAGEPEVRLEGFSGAWGTTSLRTFEIRTGPFGSALHARDYVEAGTPIVTTEHFKNGSLPTSGYGIPQVSDSDADRLSAYRLKAGDIVFSRVGSVDINAVVTPGQQGWLFSGRVLRLRLSGICDPEFLHAELQTERVRKSILTRAVGQTMPSINTNILGDTAVRVPPSMSEQRAIGALFAELDSLIAAETAYIGKLSQAKSALLQKMFPRED